MLARLLAVLVGVALLLAVVNALCSLGSGVGSVVGSSGGQVRQVLTLVALSAAWLLVNSPLEGRTLLDVVPGHGVTQADIAVAPALLLAALLAVLQLRG